MHSLAGSVVRFVVVITMGTSTNGQLSYGIVFDEDHEFPWDDEKFEGDIESWWSDVNGYANPIESPYTDEGQYKPGVDDKSPIISEYHGHRRQWLTANSVPIEIVNYCSCECPMILLATKHVECSRGYPEEINLEFLKGTDEAFRRLAEFMDRFDIHSSDEPKWWLTSYWG